MTTTPDVWLGATAVNTPGSETDAQSEPRITELTDGRILVSWLDTGDNYDNRLNGDFVGQLFEMDGTKIGSPFLMNTVWHGGSNTGSGSAQERGHDVAATPDGGWIIVYQDVNSSSTFIRYERFDANGQRIGNGSTIASGNNTDDNNVSDPSIEHNAQGDLIITFAREDGNGTDTEGWSVEVSGNTTTLHPLDDFGSRSETNWGAGNTVNDTAILSNGDIVTVNEDYAAVPNSTRINVRINNPDGTTVSSFLTQTSANPFDWTSPTVEALDGGGFVVAYVARNNNADDYGIRLAIYSNSGSTIKSPFYAAFDDNVSSSSLRYSFADVAALDDGGFLVGWVEGGTLRVQRYDGLGNTVGNQLKLSSAMPGFGSGNRFEEFELTRTQDGRVMVVWTDETPGTPDAIEFLILDPRDDGITINGTSGDDGLTTPNGGATVNAGAGADTVLGKGGDDTFIDNDFASGDRYNGRLGIDTIDYSAVTFNGTTVIDLQNEVLTNSLTNEVDILENIENVVGSQGGETIRTVNATTDVDAQGGNDRVIITEYVSDGDRYDGGAGMDWLDFSEILLISSINIEYNLPQNLMEINGSAAQQELISDFENIEGVNNPGGTTETFIGSSGVNIFNGNGGTDIFDGNGGADQLSGGSGNDFFRINSGDLTAGLRLDGGTGLDTVQVSGTGTTDFTVLQTAGFVDIERFELTSTSNQTKTLTLLASQLAQPGLQTANFKGKNGNEILQVNVNNFTADLSGLTFTDWNHSFDEAVKITGSVFGDGIIGSILDDQIDGGDGSDTIDGGPGGNDVLDGGAGTNTVSYASALSAVQLDLRLQNTFQQTGGGGSDRLTNFQNAFGSDFGDTIFGFDGRNFIRGGDGDDVIDGLGNLSTTAEIVRGEGGNDTITRHQHVNAGATLDGGDDTDLLIGLDLSSGDVVDFERGFIVDFGVDWDTVQNFENYDGFNDEDFIGNGAANRVTFVNNFSNDIETGAGDDVVNAGGGDDTITGGTGRDELFGEGGDDEFILESNHIANGEVIDGGAGAGDTISFIGGGGFDLRNSTVDDIEQLEFEVGADYTALQINARAAASIVSISASLTDDEEIQIYLDSVDAFDASGITFKDWTIGADGFDLVGNSNDNLFVGNTVGTTFRGNGGSDTVDYSAAQAPITVNLASQAGGQGLGNDRYFSIENIIGTDGEDLIGGSEAANMLDGGRGDDEIFGEGGSDILKGGRGRNIVDGGSGEDEARFAATVSAYDMVSIGGAVLVHRSATTERHLLVEIENLGFTDTTLTSDLVLQADALEYLASNTDLIGTVAANTLAVRNHYFDQGYYQNRPLDAWDEWSYLASHGDLLNAFGSDAGLATAHYVNFGFNAGRAADLFDEWSYLASTPNLIGVVDETEAAQHFVEIGLGLGLPRDAFDEWSYLASNTDLIGTVSGADAAQHYVEMGYGDGREADDFDEWSYLASNTDLIAALSANGNLAARHFVVAGFGAGRETDTFDEWSYLASNADVLAALGPDGEAATRHYVQFGFNAGRPKDTFDEWSYLASNTSLIGVVAGADAAEHYIQTGHGSGLPLDTFDEWSYLASNTDLIPALGANGNNATRHYVVAGFNAGRETDTFDEWSYLASNTDLIAALSANGNLAARHYVVAGFGAGRETDTFDEWSYLASNADVLAALGPDGEAATRHYVQFGFNAGRPKDTFDEWSYLASNTSLIGVVAGADAAEHYIQTGHGSGLALDTFDEWSYLASNTDLITALGANGNNATRHYVVAGFNAGRETDTFDEFQYIASHGDLITAFGTDGDAGTRHYAKFGFLAGRAADDFDAQQYLDNYADLQAAFGSDLDAATLHYILFGYAAGRTDDVI